MRALLTLEKRYAEFFRSWIAEFEQDIPIYLDLCGKADGPILEVGCATGRVTLRLAQAGHDVVAVDTRREMLEVAQASMRDVEGRVRVADFDLRAQAMPERFPVALVTLFAFNQLIDIEEQRLFLRHLWNSLEDDGTVAIDCFCPLSFSRPEELGQWREIRRETEWGELALRDHREMLTPLLERRTQIFRLGDEPEAEMVTHRRYVAPVQLRGLLEEAGFENVRWIVGYDFATESPIPDEGRPDGPFMILATR